MPKAYTNEEKEALKPNFTCPICGKKCRKFLAPNGQCMSMYGFVSSGQWYCGEEHAKQDPNSRYHKRLQQMNVI